jgi:SPP1 gp7 family putative phage head morphogenesis protein
MRAHLKSVVPDLKDEAADELPRLDSARMDANIEKKVWDLIKAVNAELERAFPNPMLEKWVKAHSVYLSNMSKKNIKKVAATVGMEIEPMLHDRGLAPWLQNVVDENVGLIRSMTREKQETFKNGLVAMITADAPQDEIRKLIEKNFAFSRAKARMIARDQTGKINGRINQYRQQSLGATRYIWRGSKDERERDDHRRLEGKIFSWDKPPIVDRRTGRRANPGEDYQCRCHAEMVLEDLLD